MYNLVIKDRNNRIVSTVEGSKKSIEALASLYISLGLDMGEDYDENVGIGEHTIMIKEHWIDDYSTKTLNRKIEF